MNSAVNSSTGSRKLSSPPVAHRANPTTGIIAAVTTARMPIAIVRPVTPIHSEKPPQTKANAASASVHTRCERSAPGSASAARPAAAVTTHIAPEVRSGGAPSPLGGSWGERMPDSFEDIDPHTPSFRF
jgi:hypothetical protein